jgi:hypothetical protein
MMALFIRGKSTCPLCGGVLAEADDVAAFPAFLKPDHELGAFSDTAFHRQCFEEHPRAAEVSALYRRYREIWDSRPRELKTLEEMETWGREAFKDFP